MQYLLENGQNIIVCFTQLVYIIIRRTPYYGHKSAYLNILTRTSYHMPKHFNPLLPETIFP